MGIRESKMMPAMCWIDFEGGLKTPLWDAGMIIDAHGKSSVGVRLVQFTNTAQRNKVRSSVPPAVFSRMEENSPGNCATSMTEIGT